MMDNIGGGAKVMWRGKPGKVIWMTGLSGSGKTTIAEALWKKINEETSEKCIILDGDNVRGGLCKDLSFTEEDRTENIRRVAEVADIISSYGINVITSFISPIRKDRIAARKILGDLLIEVYLNCPLEICEARDVKGLYKKVRNGEIENFTGITSPYEIPAMPNVVINTDRLTVDECVSRIFTVF